MSSVHIDLTYGINLHIVYIFIMGVVFRLIVPKIIFFMKVMLEKTRVAVIKNISMTSGFIVNRQILDICKTMDQMV